MANPTAAMVVIGDEILAGRTHDTNMHHLAGALTERGIRLVEARVVADEHDAIRAAVSTLSAAHDTVFTSGGIGPTHDDITADAVAAVFGDTIDVRADARAILEAHYAPRGVELNAARLRMARIPASARLIENPVSAAPGFVIGNVHVMAGVPRIFAAMVESVLPELAGGTPLTSESVWIAHPEGEVAAPLRALSEAFPALSFGSYPQQGTGVQVVIRGPDAAAVATARDRLQAAFPETAGSPGAHQS